MTSDQSYILISNAIASCDGQTKLLYQYCAMHSSAMVTCDNKELSYRRGTARRVMLVNSC